ncbi:MAG: THUMP domain-containing protein [archaeon]
MKALAICHKGFEDMAKKEVKELIKADSTIKDTAIIFSIKKLEDLCLLTYKAQTLIKTMFFFHEVQVSNKLEPSIKKIKEKLAKIDFKEWFDKKTSFKVKCARFGKHDYLALDIEQGIGELIIKEIEKKMKFAPSVVMDKPDLIFYVYIKDKTAYLGIDFAGKDLSKREYKLFTSQSDIKGTLAFSLLKLADYKKNKTLLDPFVGSGIIPIEAALYASQKSVRFYSKHFAFEKLKPLKKKNFETLFKKIDSKMKNDKLPIYCYDSSNHNVTSSRKNSKIAGVDKQLNFSRADIEWLDTKLDKENIDLIVTKVPCDSKQKNKKDIEKLYQELFYQAEFILKKTGRIFALCIKKDSLLEIAKKKKFKKVSEREVWAGAQSYFVIEFKK